MDDERLKQSERWDYFDEWLESTRDIRASEKRFYQKLGIFIPPQLITTKLPRQLSYFVKKVQNTMLWATTGKTAAELIESCSNPDKPNIGLTAWRGSIAHKYDVSIAKKCFFSNSCE